MPTDFSELGRSARELIPVPELPIESIRIRSQRASKRERARALVLCGAICLSALGAGLEFGGKIYDGVHMWLSGGKAAVVVRSLVITRQPTERDLRNIIARATFPVILPVGVPEGSRVNMIMFAPADRPDNITIDYENGPAKFNVGISLVDSAAINADGEAPPSTSASMPFQFDMYRWSVGGETAVVRKDHISFSEMNRIKAAMARASASDGIAATDKLLRKIIVLGGPTELADLAERFAPAAVPSVLLDAQAVRSISQLRKRGMPLLDTRTVYLSNIPSVNGEPDYSKATLHWPKEIIISARGVRAIDAVLRSSGGHDCNCEILFDQPRTTTYWVWRMSLSSSSAVKKYAVDATTFLVTPTR